MSEHSAENDAPREPDYRALWEEAREDIARYADLIERHLEASVAATRQTLDELAEDWPGEKMSRAEAQEFIRNQPVVPPTSPIPPGSTGDDR